MKVYPHLYLYWYKIILNIQAFLDMHRGLVSNTKNQNFQMLIFLYKVAESLCITHLFQPENFPPTGNQCYQFLEYSTIENWCTCQQMQKGIFPPIAFKSVLNLNFPSILIQRIIIIFYKDLRSCHFDTCMLIVIFLRSYLKFILHLGCSTVRHILWL